MGHRLRALGLPVPLQLRMRAQSADDLEADHARRAGPAPTRAKVVKALESLQSYDLGGITLGYSPTNRIGSRYVEVTVIGSNGRLMK